MKIFHQGTIEENAAAFLEQLQDTDTGTAGAPEITPMSPSVPPEITEMSGVVPATQPGPSTGSTPAPRPEPVVQGSIVNKTRDSTGKVAGTTKDGRGGRRKVVEEELTEAQREMRDLETRLKALRAAQKAHDKAAGKTPLGSNLGTRPVRKNIKAVVSTDNVAVSQTSSDDAAGSNNVSSQAETDASQRSRRSATQLEVPAYENESSSGAGSGSGSGSRSGSQRSSSGRLIKPTPVSILSKEQRRPQGTKRKTTVSESSSWEDQGARKRSKLGEMDMETETVDGHETPVREPSPSPSTQLIVRATPIAISSGESESRTERRDTLTQESQGAGSQDRDVLTQEMSSDDNRHNSGDNVQGDPADLLSPISRDIQSFLRMDLSPLSKCDVHNWEGFLRRRSRLQRQSASPEGRELTQLATSPMAENPTSRVVASGPVLLPSPPVLAPHHRVPQATPEISENSGLDSTDDTPAVIRQKRVRRDAEREVGRFITP